MSRPVLGGVALLLALGTFAACAAKNSDDGSSSADVTTFGQSGYDNLAYYHRDLLQ